MIHPTLRCTAFAGPRRIASGELRHVALKARQAFDAGKPVRVFEDASGMPVAVQDAQAAPRGPGRPKLGVVAREVTLLPGHWDWLAAQPGGASVALRALVDAARHVAPEGDRRRAAQEASYRFMQAMAGDQAGFAGACRALFAGDIGAFEEHCATWPDDVREHAGLLAADAFHH